MAQIPSVPQGYHSGSSYLIVDAAAALEFYACGGQGGHGA